MCPPASVPCAKECSTSEARVVFFHWHPFHIHVQVHLLLFFPFLPVIENRSVYIFRWSTQCCEKKKIPPPPVQALANRVRLPTHHILSFQPLFFLLQSAGVGRGCSVAPSSPSRAPKAVNITVHDDKLPEKVQELFRVPS